jgi:hypothetical protein
MEHRFGRTLRVFLVALAAAGFYRLAVVPIVEPRVRDPATDHEMTPEEAAAIRARADQRLAALGDIFPPGSWERENPIMLESRQMRLLFKDYHSLPDGRVNIVPCTLVVLPDRNRVAGDGPPGRTLVLRAPQGAVLEFDEPLDLRQGRLAKLVGGSLRGRRRRGDRDPRHRTRRARGADRRDGAVSLRPVEWQRPRPRRPPQAPRRQR